MTCTYDFRWRHIYVKCPITSGSHILDPQNPIFSFRHNFTKKHFSSKVRLIPDSARSDLSKEPTKSGYLCKSSKKIRFAVKTCTNRQVAYTFNLTLPTNPSHYELKGALLSGISNVIFTEILNFDIIVFLYPLTCCSLVQSTNDYSFTNLQCTGKKSLAALQRKEYVPYLTVFSRRHKKL